MEKNNNSIKHNDLDRLDSDRSVFTGKTFSWFGVNLAVFLGSVITLGFAYPWLKCFKQRYICAHTYVNGRGQYFDGSGVQLIGKYICWLLLTVVTLGIFSLWWRLKMRKWIAKHTHYVGAPNGDCDFDGGLLALTGIGLAAGFLNIITLGIASFWTHCWRERYYAANTVIDGHRLRFNGTGGQYFGKKIVWCLLTVVTLGIYVLWLSLKSKQWTALHTEMESPQTLPFDSNALYNEAGERAQQLLALHKTKEWKRSVVFLVISILFTASLLGVRGDNSSGHSSILTTVLYVVVFSLISFFQAKKIKYTSLMVGSLITLFLLLAAFAAYIVVALLHIQV